LNSDDVDFQLELHNTVDWLRHPWYLSLTRLSVVTLAVFLIKFLVTLTSRPFLPSDYFPLSFDRFLLPTPVNWLPFIHLKGCVHMVLQ
jgi:hypothetical protein